MPNQVREPSRISRSKRPRAVLTGQKVLRAVALNQKLTGADTGDVHRVIWVSNPSFEIVGETA